MVSLDTKLGGVIGKPSTTALKNAFELETVGDLLGHYPRRLHDAGELSDFSDLRLDEHVTVIAKVLKVENKRYVPKSGGRPAYRTELSVTDGERELSLTFFRQPWRVEKLSAGTIAMFSGKVGKFRGRSQLAQPTCEVLGVGADLEEYADHDVPRWIPIYPAASAITSEQIRECVKQTLLVLDPVPDPVPADVRPPGLLSYDEAVRAIHQPESLSHFESAKDRLRFDEAFVLQVVLAQRRQETLAMAATPRPGKTAGLVDRFDTGLPFVLTGGQREIGDVLTADLRRTHPMHRLLQGEVGSGKTVVALRAMLRVIDSGGQAALLAPTEVLAVQHHRSIVALLGPLAEGGMLGGDDDATRIELVTGSMPAARRRAALLNVASGVAGITVGTHALLEERVQFAELGLVVVDEQHRFGVEQRSALTGKSGGATAPHVLVMTATPIPRTVAMTVFGDLDVSTLRELPGGRSPIQSAVVPSTERPDWLNRAWQRVREEVTKGHQVYVVCPRIGGDAVEGSTEEAPADDQSEDTRRAPLAVADVAAELADGALAGLRIAILHGRLATDEKDRVMRHFAAGEVEVLVATTVIEVGVDVANASVMVVLDADRYGVSQLHQLRGRVGRGSVPGLCLLVTDALEGSAARERLDAVAATSDGFELARVDLEHRREGDVLGSTQSGRHSSLKLLSVLRDEEVISDARAAADAVVADDPKLERHPVLAAVVASLLATEQASFLEKS
jgi:ATP-dependent DNA helicase RecG